MLADFKIKPFYRKNPGDSTQLFSRLQSINDNVLSKEPDARSEWITAVLIQLRVLLRHWGTWPLWLFKKHTPFLTNERFREFKVNDYPVIKSMPLWQNVGWIPTWKGFSFGWLCWADSLLRAPINEIQKLPCPVKDGEADKPPTTIFSLNKIIKYTLFCAYLDLHLVIQILIIQEWVNRFSALMKGKMHIS